MLLEHAPEPRQRIELLAPAGNADALHAAVAAGADAVYLGMGVFNARRNAHNFTDEEFACACDYAHLRGVKVYVALNTIILPHEIDEALECARQAYRRGADAFIVQDVGLASELHRSLPQARLHASTQMNIHQAAGIEAAAKLGIRRVTLARELTLDEVSHLACVASSYNVEVETFVHGALCVCYSGQCMLSSLIGGRSANRGLCAQACRLPYELCNRAQRGKLNAPGEHLLSPADLCAIDLLPSLIDAGVASLKIEGRMKSADYVFNVTSIYRAVLNRALDTKVKNVEDTKINVGASDEEYRLLEESFSRGFTTAYLTGNRGNEIMSYARPNNRGKFIGRISQVQDGVATLDFQYPLHEGDVLEFWTNKGHFAQTLKDFTFNKNNQLCFGLEHSAKAGDRVFRLRDAQASFVDDEFEPRIAINGNVRLRKGMPLYIEFTCVDKAFTNRVVAGEMPYGDAFCRGVFEGNAVEQARTKPLEEQDVRKHINRLGQTPFVLRELTVDLDEGVGLGFSQLHKGRTQALEMLRATMLAPYAARRLPRVSKGLCSHIMKSATCTVAALVSNPVCARAAKRAGADLVYVSALSLFPGESSIAGQLNTTAHGTSYPNSCGLLIPAVDHDASIESFEKQQALDVWKMVKPGARVIAENLGCLLRAVTLNAQVEVGPHVPLSNHLSLQAVASLGACRVWLSPELNLKQIAALAAQSPLDLGVNIIGAQELMVCEHCLLMSSGPCAQHCAECARRKSPHVLKDRKGYEFPIITDAFGRSHLYNGVALDVAHALPDLLAAGISTFLVDTTLMNVEQTQTAIRRAVRACRVALKDGNGLAKTPGTTAGHLFRGVS